MVPSRTGVTIAYIWCTRHVIVGSQWTRSDCVIEGTVVSNCTVLRYRTAREADLSSRTNLTLHLGFGSLVWDHQSWLTLQRPQGSSRAVKTNWALLANGNIRPIWGRSGTSNVTQIPCRTIIGDNATLTIMSSYTRTALVYIAQASFIAVCKCSIRADHWCVCPIRTVMMGRTC